MARTATPVAIVQTLGSAFFAWVAYKRQKAEHLREKARLEAELRREKEG